MGERCTQYRFLGEPMRLRSTSSSALCDRCIQERYTLADAPTLSPHAPPKEGPFAGLLPVDESPQPAEEVLGEVIRAAKVLFKENITDEEVIIPTLAFANQASALSVLETVRKGFAATVDDPEHREEFARAHGQGGGEGLLRGHPKITVYEVAVEREAERYYGPD